MPGAFEAPQDQQLQSNPAPATLPGAGVAGKLDENEGDEFEGGNNTNFLDQSIDLANYDTNKTSQNLIQNASEKNVSNNDDNVTQVGQNEVQMSNLK